MVDELKQIGARLRALRNDRGWTLDELASRADMSPSTLSRLESGKRQASLELLLPLTRQLCVSLDDLVSPPVRDPRVRRPAIRRDGMIIAPLAPEGSPIGTYKITYPPVDEPPEPRVHDGYEWLYVLSGRLRLILGDQDLVLTGGEAAEFDTRVPHSISADGPDGAEMLSIFNNDGVRMHTHTAEEFFD
ncbi:MAG: XRE family transcriptional regulator [Gordonia sp. (in: high G+C Gram-positive bacteria)]|uniref:helix-turn-helix domain-containing protein n=1 Tax=Gordonia sp. (in: high G+C Gram-positive bacteria) TaxID=84139 RepID=UPI0039E49FAE